MSSAGNSSDAANLKKLESILLTSKTKIEEIESIKLFGIWKEELRKFLKSFLKSIVNDLENQAIPEFRSKADNGLLKVTSFDVYLDKTNNALDGVLRLIDSILYVVYKNSSLHEFISYILRDLKLSNDIRYILCIGDNLSTVPLTATWIDILSQNVYFKHTNDFLSKYKTDHHDFYVVFIPSLILQKKEYWSALIHELGHIIIDSFNIVESIYPKVYPIKVDTPQSRDYYHSREYASDFIGNGYMGRIYIDTMYELLYSASINLGNTHPPWDARMYFLQKTLGNINIDRELVKDTPHESHVSINRIDEIVEKIKKQLGDFMYSDDPDQSKNAVNNLKNGVPFIGPPRLLLNSYWEKKDEITKHIVSERGKSGLSMDASIVEQDLGKIIEDSFRLSNMKRTYNLMTEPKV